MPCRDLSRRGPTGPVASAGTGIAAAAGRGVARIGGGLTIQQNRIPRAALGLLLLLGYAEEVESVV
jgi:hypothetical protein